MSNALEKLSDFKSNIPDKSKNNFKGRSNSFNINQDLDFSNLSKSDQFIEKLKASHFNLDEMEDAIKQKGSQLIVAIAGSGKTTTLLCKLQYNILTGELTKKIEYNDSLMCVMSNVFVCTFLKSGAEDLKKKMIELQASLGLQSTAHMINFSTLHAEFYKILRELGYSLNIISEKENTNLLKRSVNALKIKYNDKTLNSTQIADLESALNFTRSRLDEKKYEPEIYLECSLGPSEVDNLISNWRKLRVLENKMDFSDLEEILYKACYLQPNEKIINHIANKYDYIYIDAFQDTSQIQYKLLKILSMNAKKVVAVGDDDQTIYSWRGSDINIITNEFVKDFEASVSKLTYNFRCPSNILNMVKPSIERYINRIEKEIKAFNQGGISKVFRYSTLSEASAYLQTITYNALKENKNTTVICRTNMGGLIPALTFENSGRFAFSISSRAMSLDNYIGRLILRIGKLFYSHSEDVIKSVISQISWDGSYKVGMMAKYCDENNLTIFDIHEDDLYFSLPQTANTLIMWKRVLSQEGEMSCFFRILDYFKQVVFLKENSFNNNCREVINAIQFFAETRDFKKVRDVVEGLYNLNLSLVSRIDQSNVRVKVVTAHEFKGKESDVVVVWDDSEKVFPPTMEINVDDFEEERRVHYIACTRATKEMHVISNKSKPSLFFKEMDLSCAKEGYCDE